MADAFGRQDQILMGSLSSDSMFMSWPELAAVGGGLGMLIQSVGLDYRQPIRRVFEIGPGVIPLPLQGVGISAFQSAAYCDTAGADSLCQYRAQPTYYIIGRPEGRLQFGHYVGPNVLSVEFLRAYGNGCSSNVVTLSGTVGCGVGSSSSSRMTWSMGGVVFDSMNMNVNGQEMVIQQALSAMFSSLTIDAANSSLVGANGSITPPSGTTTPGTTTPGSTNGPLDAGVGGIIGGVGTFADGNFGAGDLPPISGIA